MKLDQDLSDLSPALVLDGAVALPAAPSADLLPEEIAAHAKQPTLMHDLVELSKLRLNFMVLVTTMVGYAMSNPVWSNWGLLLHTLIGTALTAAAASILNQYIEQPHDILMVRTKRRPLPAGRITPIAALSLGVVAGVVGLLELYFWVNPLTASIGAVTTAIYILVYTPLKRVTTLNTVVGAIPGALPPVMGVAAVSGEVTPIGWALFGILFFWQMPHFLAIAILYREDYARGGFKMLPVVDPELIATGRQMIFYALALIPVSMLPSVLRSTGPFYFIAALAMGLAFLGFVSVAAVTRRRGDARQVFLASILYLPCLLAAMIVDKL
ncbi:heme o synthase [Humisphaera borealis]|uniref:Protoheme IX farnesyltransferase n=1 Tax=Humisphaera borealis TaxID=2807512 RepID=A0A7M2X0P5_9BACT|nr:heme o synthase [Humisphaera borealis]QOV91316.1 protoheme IX farnesyltransferase [Humisphaera borealis]